MTPMILPASLLSPTLQPARVLDAYHEISCHVPTCDRPFLPPGVREEVVRVVAMRGQPCCVFSLALFCTPGTGLTGTSTSLRSVGWWGAVSAQHRSHSAPAAAPSSCTLPPPCAVSLDLHSPACATHPSPLSSGSLPKSPASLSN